jgi:hypothetical protein
MPDTYHTAGIRRDRHLNFYENRDNLTCPASRLTSHRLHDPWRAARYGDRTETTTSIWAEWAVRFRVREWFDGHEDVLPERLWNNRSLR